MATDMSSGMHSAADPAVTAPCRSVLMVGTHLETTGGMTTVVSGYMTGGLFARFNCRFIPMHRRGPIARKAWAAACGWIRILIELHRLDAPLVHVHMAARGSFWRKALVCVTARMAGRPYLVHLHGSEFMKFYDEECGAVARRCVANILHDAALVLALSEEWRTRILRIAPDSRVVVLRNGVPLPDLQTLPQRDTQTPIILCLGLLGRRKGSFDLLEAFAQIRHPSARLICAGDGEVSAVREHARTLGIADRVDCPGWLIAPQTAQALASATLFALPSYAEGLPMALLEAMAYALPVVSTPVGGIPDAVRHGENGLLVTPGKVEELAGALSMLLREPATRARLGAAARRTIEERFSQQASLSELGCIYRRFGLRPADSAA